VFRMKMVLAAVAAFGMLLPFGARGKEYVFPDMSAGKVLADIPPDWTGTAPPASIPEATTSRFTPESSQDRVILVTIMQVVPGSAFASKRREGIEELVATSAEQAATQSEEGSLKVENFSSESVFGSYFSATDKAPPPGEYKYMTQGVASFGNLVINFIALSHGDPDETRDVLLGILKSLKLQGGKLE
jgi:hypothetical protein